MNSTSSSLQDEAYALDRPHNNKKKLFIVLIILGAALVVALVSWSTYALLDNLPEKIIRDSFYNTSAQRAGAFDATYTYGGEASKYRIGAKGSWSGTAVSMTASLGGDAMAKQTYQADFVSKDSNFYLKLKDVDKLAAQMFAGDKKAAELYGGLVAKLNNKWLLISDKDIEDITGQQGSSQMNRCVEKAVSLFQNDKAQQREVFIKYERNKFIDFKKLPNETVDGRDTHRFSLTTDSKLAKAYIKSLNDTTVYKNLRECTKSATKPEGMSAESISASSSEVVDEIKPAIELWVDVQTRTMKKVSVKTYDARAKSATELVAVLDFEKQTAVTTPKSDTTVPQIKTELQNIMKASSQQSASKPVLGAQTSVSTGTSRSVPQGLMPAVSLSGR